MTQIPLDPGKRIWPCGPEYANITPLETFNIHIISEGYKDDGLGTTKAQFERDCYDVVLDLLKISPFNLLNDWSKQFAVYTYFNQSPRQNSGIPDYVSDPSQYEMPFETWIELDSNNQALRLHFNPDLVINKLNTGKIVNDTIDSTGNSVPHTFKFSEIFSSYEPIADHPEFTRANGIIILLFPQYQSFDIMKVKDGILAFPNTRRHGRAVAWQIALSMGLLPEYELSGIDKQSPTQSDLIEYLKNSPNIIYSPSPLPNPYTLNNNFKWHYLMTSQERGIPLTVQSHDPNQVFNPSLADPVSVFTFDLLQGGAGYREKVYRTSAPCILKHKYGETPYMVDLKTDFCPVCNAVLRDIIMGTALAKIYAEKRTIATQKLKYDTVPWENETISHLKNGNQIETQTGGIDYPPILTLNGEYWSYKLHIENTNSFNVLKISQVKVKGQQRPTSYITEDVLDWLQFKDIGVYFDGDSNFYPFDFRMAFQNKRVVKYEGASSSGHYGDKFHHGIKLSFFDDYEGTCKVNVELSISCREPSNDFDPGELALALKMYPQISLSWEPMPEGTPNARRVTKFSGKVELLVSTHHNAQHPYCGIDNRNNIDLFTDTNTSVLTHSPLDRKRKYNPPPNYPPVTFIPNMHIVLSWCNIFDYYFSNESLRDNYNSQRKIIGVWGPNNYQFEFSRIGNTSYPNGNFNLYVIKAPRQGHYDNVHVSGSMGYYPVPNQDSRVIAAPICAEDCLHLHWRWGQSATIPALGAYVSNYLSNSNVATRTRNQFLGWGHDQYTAQSNSQSLAPLIPPNQHLEVEIEEVSLFRKRISYNVSVIEPKPVHKQVILEQGLAWAAKLYNISNLKRIDSFLNNVDPIDDSLSDYEYVREAYYRIRFFDSDGNFNMKRTPQIPEGSFQTTPLTGPQTSLENL
jgi:hypothetical protein